MAAAAEGIIGGVVAFGPAVEAQFDAGAGQAHPCVGFGFHAQGIQLALVGVGVEVHAQCLLVGLVCLDQLRHPGHAQLGALGEDLLATFAHLGAGVAVAFNKAVHYEIHDRRQQGSMDVAREGVDFVFAQGSGQGAEDSGFLAVDIVEEGAFGYFCGVADVFYGDAIKAAVEDQPGGVFLDGGFGCAAFAFAQGEVGGIHEK